MGLNLISANISMMLIGEKCQTFFSEIVFYVWGHWQFTVWLFLSFFICWILYLAFNAIALLGLAFRCLAFRNWDLDAWHRRFKTVLNWTCCSSCLDLVPRQLVHSLSLCFCGLAKIWMHWWGDIAGKTQIIHLAHAW